MKRQVVILAAMLAGCASEPARSPEGPRDPADELMRVLDEEGADSDRARSLLALLWKDAASVLAADLRASQARALSVLAYHGRIREEHVEALLRRKDDPDWKLRKAARNALGWAARGDRPEFGGDDDWEYWLPFRGEAKAWFEGTGEMPRRPSKGHPDLCRHHPGDVRRVACPAQGFDEFPPEEERMDRILSRKFNEARAGSQDALATLIEFLNPAPKIFSKPATEEQRLRALAVLMEVTGRHSTRYDDWKSWWESR